VIGTNEHRANTHAVPARATHDVSPMAYEIQSVQFRYRSDTSPRANWILNDVGFHVISGEVLGIVGPNGSGKTSLLKVLANILAPQQGSLRLFGQDVATFTQQEVARRVAYVPQEIQQVFPFTVAETVVMGRFAQRIPTLWSGGFGWEDETDLTVAAQAMAMMDIGPAASGNGPSLPVRWLKRHGCCCSTNRRPFSTCSTKLRSVRSCNDSKESRDSPLFLCLTI
jgi:ABC-type molybdenum transport system ATPase subunit/photorepair protein PhrA